MVYTYFIGKIVQIRRFAVEKEEERGNEVYELRAGIYREFLPELRHARSEKGVLPAVRE